MVYNETYFRNKLGKNRKNMDELATILKHEEDNKDKLILAEKKSEEEIESKEKQLREEVLEKAGLTESEKSQITAKYKEKIEKVGKELKEEFDLAMARLEEKRKDNTKKAVGYILKNSLEE